jgi:hypothetical protein
MTVDRLAEVVQLLIDALRAVNAGGEDGYDQARVKLDQAQEALDAAEGE